MPARTMFAKYQASIIQTRVVGIFDASAPRAKGALALIVVSLLACSNIIAAASK